MVIPPFPSAPKIDGVLDPEIRHPHGILHPVHAHGGRGPSEQTIGYVGHDRDFLSLAFRGFDSDPKAIRARLTPRDQSRDDDGIRIFHGTGR